MKSLSRPLAFTLLLGSLGLIGWGGGAPSFPSSVISPQAQGSPAQGRVYGGYALTSYAPNDPPTTYAISKIVVSNATTGANGTATYTLTVSPAETFTAGQSVTVFGLTGNFTLLNNVAPVLADDLTATTFSISTTDVYGTSSSFALGVRYATIDNGTYSTTDFGTNGVVSLSSSELKPNPRDPHI